MSSEPREVSNVSYDFSGSVVLITGGGRGQGRSHALAFAEAGADVVIGDIGDSMSTIPYELTDSEKLSETAAEVETLGARCLPTVCDVRDPVQVKAMVDDAIEQFGKIDILINNAGLESFLAVEDMSEEAWDQLVDTMLKGPFLCSKAVSAEMIKRGNGGRIITTGSTASTAGMPRQAHYCAAKHGVVGFTRALAIELAEHAITVNVVCPTGIDTPMIEALMASRDAEWFQMIPELTGPYNLLSPGELLNTQEITSAMLWLASDAAKFVTGSSLVVDAGYGIK